MAKELPEINQDLFGRIDKIIQSEPESFEMGCWERPSIQFVSLDGETVACGTTRCVAGWAIHLTHEDKFGATGKPLSKMTNDLGGHPEAYARVGAEVLGLTKMEADELFYGSNYGSKNVLHAYATGGRKAGLEAMDEYKGVILTEDTL